MSDKKQVQIIIRTTEEEKQIISKKASESGLSVNQYIKQILLETNDKNDSNDDNKNINNDSKDDIIEILKEQLTIKDNQIENFQKIIYNSETKLIELSQKKHWYEFWKE